MGSRANTYSCCTALSYIVFIPSGRSSAGLLGFGINTHTRLIGFALYFYGVTPSRSRTACIFCSSSFQITLSIPGVLLPAFLLTIFYASAAKLPTIILWIFDTAFLSLVFHASTIRTCSTWSAFSALLHLIVFHAIVLFVFIISLFDSILF